MSIEEKTIFAKDIKIELASDWRKSRVIIDGKNIPVMEIEISQGKSTDWRLVCKLVMFPDKVIWVKEKGNKK